MGRISDLSFKAMQKLGEVKSSSHKGRPAFTVEDFKQGVKNKEIELADKFIDFVAQYYRENPPDLSVISYELKTSDISDRKLLQAIHQKGKIVFIAAGFAIANYSYKEIWSMLEFGRVDKNITPHPILREAFKNYKPYFEKEVRKFLKGNKP